MQAATILGTTRATKKHESLEGQRLLIAQPKMIDGSDDGPPLIVIDQLGCRVGDEVMLTSDGSLARVVTGNNNTPARWSVAGLIDEIKDN